MQEGAPKPRIIQLKGESGKIQSINLNNLEKIFVNIGAHNKEFSFGAMLAKGISSRVEKSPEEDEKADNPFLKESDRAGALTETLGIIHADSFAPIGISLDTESEGGIKLLTKDGEISTSQLRFGLNNPDLFLSFLDELGKIDKGELHKSGMPLLLGKIGYDTFLQIYQHYSNFYKDQRAPQTARRLDEILLKYKNLGIRAQHNGTDRTEDLETYAKYAKQDLLEEYIVSKRNGLFVEPGQSYDSLSNWRNDILAKDVQERWGKAFSIMEDLKKKPKAQNMFAELKTHLLACAESALNDMNAKGNEGWKDKKEKREIFENARINLQMT